MGTTIEDMVAREKKALSMLARAKGVTPAELGEACEILPRVAAYLLARLEGQGYARHCGLYRWIVYSATAEGAETAYAAREGERSKAMQAASSNRSERIPGTFEKAAAGHKPSKPSKKTEKANARRDSSKKKAKRSAKEIATEIGKSVAKAVAKKVKISGAKVKRKGAKITVTAAEQAETNAAAADATVI